VNWVRPSREGPFGQGGQGAGHPHRADGDAALGHAQITAEAGNRFQHIFCVEQGLAHAHEHHMAGATPHHFSHAQHLIDDFMNRQGTLQALLAGGAEAAGHGAPHLAAEADGEAIFGGDAHRFEAEAVVGSQQQLGGAVASDGLLKNPGATQKRGLLPMGLRAPDLAGG
jgi:hypothetical protein